MDAKITPPQVLSQYDRDFGQAGVFAPNEPLGFATRTGSSNVAFLSRVHISRPMTIASVSFNVTAWSAGDTADPACDVGIYNTSGTRLGSAGATTGKLNSTGMKTVSLSANVPLTPGVYYVALSFGSLGTSSVTVWGWDASPSGAGATWLGTAAPACIGFNQGTSHPLPSSLTLNTTNFGGYPRFALREA